MRKRTLSLALAVSMAAMSLAGCGGGGGTTATTAAAGGETTAAASEAATEAAPTTAVPSPGENYGPGYVNEATTAAAAETNQAPSDMGLISPNGQ